MIYLLGGMVMDSMQEGQDPCVSYRHMNVDIAQPQLKIKQDSHIAEGRSPGCDIIKDQNLPSSSSRILDRTQHFFQDARLHRPPQRGI